MEFYKNGELVWSKNLEASLDSFVGHSLKIGGDPTSSKYFAGTIDEVRIHSQALSDTEIKIAIEATQPVVQPSPGPARYKDAFRLSTGELIIGELVSFDGTTFTIRTEAGVIQKKRLEVVNVSLAPSRE